MREPNYSFQKGVENEVIEILLREGKCLLAAAPASGKTQMSLNIIKRLNFKKTMIFAHGTIVLKKQYSDSLIKVGMVHGLNEKITVSLPQSSKKYRGSIDLLVVDEAHHFYYAKTVQAFIKSTKPRYILVMTGTPGIFNATRDFPAVYVPTEYLLSQSVISNPEIKLEAHNLKLSFGSYNKEDNLKKSAKFKQHQVDEIVESLDQYKGKTIIVCKDLIHSRQVEKALVKRGEKVLLSNYKDDYKSVNIDKFRVGKTRYLLVIRRAILGFSMNNLSNILDFSGSMNVDFLFQLINRVTRIGIGKKFIKVCEKNLFEYQYSALNAACALVIRDFYQTYTPQSINRLEFPMKREVLNGMNSEQRQTRTLNDNMFSIDLEFLIRNYDNKEVYAHTNLSKIKHMYYSQAPTHTLEECIELAKECGNKSEFYTKYRMAYNYLLMKDREAFAQIFPIAQKTRITLKKALEVAKTFPTRKELRKNSRIYTFLLKNHSDELDKLFPKLRDPISLGSAVGLASKCIDRRDFSNKHGASYKFLKKFHPDELDKIFPPTDIMDLESAVKIAKKCRNRGHLKEVSAGAYELLRNKYPNILDELMPKSNADTRINEAIVAAKSVKTRIEFKKKYPSMCALLMKYRRNELNEIFPPAKKKTFDEAIKIARAHNNRDEFRNEHNAEYKFLVKKHKSELDKLFPPYTKLRNLE